MVNVVYCSGGENTTFQSRGTNNLFLLIVVTNVVSQLSGDF